MCLVFGYKRWASPRLYFGLLAFLGILPEFGEYFKRRLVQLFRVVHLGGASLAARLWVRPLNIPHAKTPVRPVFVAHELLFHFQNFVAPQKCIHLLQSPAAVADRDGKEFELHNIMIFKKNRPPKEAFTSQLA